MKLIVVFSVLVGFSLNVVFIYMTQRILLVITNILTSWVIYLIIERIEYKKTKKIMEKRLIEFEKDRAIKNFVEKESINSTNENEW